MKTHILSIILCLLTASLAGCADDTPGNPREERPGEQTGTDDAPGFSDDPDFDFTPELDDHDSRIYGLGQAIRYGETPGALFKRSDTAVEIVDITTGRRITYSLTDGTLTDSGRSIAISDSEIVRDTGSELYIHLLTPDRNHIVIAVTDL